MLRNADDLRREDGYTLVELLVAIAIILLIIPVLYASIETVYSSHARTIARAFALIEASHGVETIVRDVRAAVYAEDGSLPLVSIGTSSLTLFADTDYDGRVERVRYFLASSTLSKGTIEPTSTSSYPTASETVTTVARGITNSASSSPLFRYYSATSSPIVSASSSLLVRRIEVEVIAQARFRRELATTTLQSSASIRNLKDQY